MNPKIRPISTNIVYDVVEIVFEDGLTARFIPYRHGAGYQIEGLHSVEFIRDNMRIFVFNSRIYRAGPQPSEHKIVKMIGLTQKQASEYWASAKEYVTNLFRPNLFSTKTNDEYWYHWIVLTEGYFDLNRLKEGKAEFIEHKR